MKNKTIKDLVIKPDYRMAFMKGNLISEEELKRETIKWIKKDIKELGYFLRDEIIIRWIERLELTERDLK